MLTKNQVLDRLMTYDRSDLYDICCEAYKDQYGVKGRHLSDYTISELVNWWVSHYEWDERRQLWDTKIPFNDM